MADRPGYMIIIKRFSPDASGSPEGIVPGYGNYATQPEGERVTMIQPTNAQLVGLQGYISCIKAGQNTAGIETAVTAVGPT